MTTQQDPNLKELSYRDWHRLAKALRSRRMDADRIMAIVAEHPDVLVYVRRNEEGGLSPHILLWSGEVRAAECHIKSPSPVHQKIPRAVTATSPVGLRAVMADINLFEGLLERLKSVLLYDPAPLPDYPEWVWIFSGGEHSNLLINNSRLVPPPGWEMKDGRFDKLAADQGATRIIDGKGRMGLLTDMGEVALPCSFPYLSRPRYGDHLAFEASTDAIPKQWDACDLVDSSGQRLNPADIKIKAGTLWSDIAVVHPGDSGLTGFMTSKGELLGDRRWKDVRKFSEYLAAVQDPEIGLWGYINDEGAVAIEPRYTAAQGFDRGHAVVAMPDSGGLFGLIDSNGTMVVPPVWRKIDWLLGKYYTATDTEDALGLIDNRGNVVIEPFYPSREEDAEIDAAKGTIRQHPFVRKLGERLKEMVDGVVRDADTLASLTGLFSPLWAKDMEVRASGLWGRQVTLVANYQAPGSTIDLRAGDSGKIAWYSPVIGNIFDLSAEAPVYGLSAMPHSSVGVPWGLLRVAREKS